MIDEDVAVVVATGSAIDGVVTVLVAMLTAVVLMMGLVTVRVL